MDKKRKILISEIIIILLMILAFLLPNLIGTIEGKVKTENSIASMKDINGKTITYLKSDNLEKILGETFPEAKLMGADSKEQMCDLLRSGEASVIVAVQSKVDEILKEDENFIIFPVTVFVHSYDPYEEVVEFIIHKDNCAFATTSKTNKDANKSGVKIGMLMGSDLESLLKKEFPLAQLLYFNTNGDIVEAVNSGKVDFGTSYLNDTATFYEEYDDLALIPEVLAAIPSSFLVAKSERGKLIYEELTQYIDEIRANGVYDDIDNRWLRKPDNKYLDAYSFTGEKGPLKVVTCGVWNPKSYMLNNEIAGSFIEVIYGFCAKYGYKPEVTVADFSAELTGITTGMYDVMADIASETPERAELVYFTQNVSCGINCFLVKGNVQNTKEVSKASAFFSSLKDSFERTFIREKRYEMIGAGLLTTVELSIFSIICGTLLSCLICKMRMSDNAFVTAVARIYIKFLQCTPIVVMLMILYYIVFKDISAFWVCIIGFTLDFSAYCAEQLRTSIESVPSGQFRAAIALGFTRTKAFFKVVLPQALIRFIPLYSGQIIGTIKLTSVAGYITVMDLTKVSDLVRARTFDAFFPLITTALIYFAISCVLIMVLKRVEVRVDPKLRKRNKGLIGGGER